VNGLTAAPALADLCTFLNGGTPSKSVGRYFEGDIPWITGADIEGPIAYEARSFITQEAVEASATNQAPPGAVLLVTRTSVGKVAIAGRRLCFSQDITALSPDSDKLDARYLAHFLRTQKVRFVSEARGATIKGITRDVVANTRVPLPSISEQRRIAAILDQAETLRTQRRAAIAHLDSLAQAIFLEMFGDPALNSHGWPVCALEFLIRPGDSLNYGVIQPGDDVDEGIPLVRVGDLVSGRVRLSSLKKIAPEIESAYKRSRLKGDEILVSCVGSIGIVALVDSAMRGFNIARAVARIPLAGSVDRLFVAEYLKSAYVQNYFTSELRTVSQPTLNIKQICETKVVLPPLGLQQEFARRLGTLERLKLIHCKALARLDELFTSLQHRAFRGELAASSAAASNQMAPTLISLVSSRELESAVGLEALIYVAKRMPVGRHHHYKSLKALYFADKRHLEKHGRLIYGETHSALPHGPVPQAAYDATRVLNGERLISDFDDEALRAGLSRIKNDQQDKLVALRDADFSKLGQAERESLEWAIRYCADMNFEQVKAASHDEAYERTQPNKPIPVAYLVDMLPADARERHWAR